MDWAHSVDSRSQHHHVSSAPIFCCCSKTKIPQHMQLDMFFFRIAFYAICIATGLACRQMLHCCKWHYKIFWTVFGQNQQQQRVSRFKAVNKPLPPFWLLFKTFSNWQEIADYSRSWIKQLVSHLFWLVEYIFVERFLVIFIKRLQEQTYDTKKRQFLKLQVNKGCVLKNGTNFDNFIFQLFFVPYSHQVSHGFLALWQLIS